MRITVAQAAKLMNVSPRGVYDCRALMRTGRQDLLDRIRDGHLTINAAMIEAGLRSRPTALQKLITAWNACSEDEQCEFIDHFWAQAANLHSTKTGQPLPD